MSYLRTYAPVVTLGLAIACLYCFGLSHVGVLGPDEPRYLAVGQAMARGGDFITPHLWGAPWFEKPPLLYWLTAFGVHAGLGPEQSGRLPIALMSVSFLLVMFALVKQEFGRETARVSAALLASSAGWLTFSGLALTDLPLAVCFSVAVLLAVPLVGSPQTGHTLRWITLGIFLGLAVLAKGLVPAALALPFAWFLRPSWRRWWLALAAFLVVAAPWYVAVSERNGMAFFAEFFWKHHVERLYSPSLLHVQPLYYYLPVLLGALFPWTPLFVLFLRRKSMLWDERRRFLAAVFLFGLLVFSLSLNKLPGYLLPLLPPAFLLLGSYFETRQTAELSRAWLLPSACLIGLLPIVARVLPAALAAGRLSLHLPPAHISRTDLFYIAAPLAVVGFARRTWALDLLVLCVVAGGLFLKIVSFPVLDRQVSPRLFWEQRVSHIAGSVCDNWANRDWAYGIAFYRGAPYPACSSGQFDYALESPGHGPPLIRPLK